MASSKKKVVRKIKKKKKKPVSVDRIEQHRYILEDSSAQETEPVEDSMAFNQSAVQFENNIEEQERAKETSELI